MNKLKNINWKRLLSTTAWILVTCCTLVLLVSAVYKTDRRRCKGINIHIEGASNHFFIDEKDIRSLIDTYCGAHSSGQAVSKFDLRSVEQSLERDIWIRNAELFFDANGILQVEVDEREPIARIFTQTGGSFYIDSSQQILPLSEKLSARVPVFTGFPTDTRVLSPGEKELMSGIKDISEGLLKDTFLMAMIDQVDITPSGKFELIPKLGDQVVVFGDAAGHEEKFGKLKLFYKKVMPGAGWNKYSVINLSFNNQVVARVRSKEEVRSDSLRTLELMKLVAEYTEKMAGDTVFTGVAVEDRSQDFSMVMQSVQREETPEVSLPAFEKEEASEARLPEARKTEPANPDPKPVTPRPAAKKPAVKKPVVKKPIVKKPVLQKKATKPPITDLKKKKEVPKAVMKKPEAKKPNNDY